jgi:hypothetical protein
VDFVSQLLQIHALNVLGVSGKDKYVGAGVQTSKYLFHTGHLIFTLVIQHHLTFLFRVHGISVSSTATSLSEHFHTILSFDTTFKHHHIVVNILQSGYSHSPFNIFSIHSGTQHLIFQIHFSKASVKDMCVYQVFPFTHHEKTGISQHSFGSSMM